MELSRLQELASPQDAALEAIDVSGSRHRVLEEARAGSQSSTRWRALAAVAAAAAVVAGLWLFWRAPLGFSVEGRALAPGAWWTAPPGGSNELVFTDGTRFVLSPQTRIRVREVTADGAHLDVDSGRVWAHVQPLPDARWTLSLGPYRIRVTGTIFEASWDPTAEHLDVELVEGGVMILGPQLGTGLSLKAGERMSVASNSPLRLGKLDEKISSEAPTPPPHPSVVQSAAPPPPPSSAASQAPSSRPAPTRPKAMPSWLALAREKRFDEALAAARAHGWERLCGRSSAEQLMMLADVARFGGDGGASRQALLALRKRFPDHALSPRAAFLLGRSAFAARSGDWGAAWFSAYLAEAPKGVLAAEALGRLMEAHRGAGNAEQARAAAESYLQHHPNGPYAPRAGAVLKEKNP
jgi:hypothetical protein